MPHADMSRTATLLAGLRVLIVEDEYFVADHLKRLLLRNGATTVYLSGDFDDAMAQVAADGFEVALLDINLHGEKSYPIADELMRVGIPFAFVTGYEQKLIPERYDHIACWTKLVADDTLVQAVARLWKGSGRLTGRPMC